MIKEEQQTQVEPKVLKALLLLAQRRDHLWVKELVSGEEQWLTAQAGYLGAMNFPQDGRPLVFAANQHCANTSDKQEAPIADRMCWCIGTLDLAQTLAAPAKPELRYQCQASFKYLLFIFDFPL